MCKEIARTILPFLYDLHDEIMVLKENQHEKIDKIVKERDAEPFGIMGCREIKEKYLYEEIGVSSGIGRVLSQISNHIDSLEKINRI